MQPTDRPIIWLVPPQSDDSFVNIDASLRRWKAPLMTAMYLAAKTCKRNVTIGVLVDPVNPSTYQGIPNVDHLVLNDVMKDTSCRIYDTARPPIFLNVDPEHRDGRADTFTLPVVLKVSEEAGMCLSQAEGVHTITRAPAYGLTFIKPTPTRNLCLLRQIDAYVNLANFDDWIGR